MSFRDYNLNAIDTDIIRILTNDEMKKLDRRYSTFKIPKELSFNKAYLATYSGVCWFIIAEVSKENCRKIVDDSLDKYRIRIDYWRCVRVSGNFGDYCKGNPCQPFKL